ncbi:MAG TPA: BACON domain-containing protein [Myxococcaceae bacterium]|nr:BACON domain-containing protein [Myxococcaceae bacterium]
MRSNPRQRSESRRGGTPRPAAWILAAFVALAGAPSTALATPPEVEAFAGVVGGTPTNGVGVPGPCSTYGAPAPEVFFLGVGMSVPTGGIAYCGYAGALTDNVGAVGPLSAAQTLAPVLLGNPGAAGTYGGSAEASADFKVLKARASGTVTAPGGGSPLALGNSSAAAIFDDMLTVTSNRVSSPSPGFVRYTFSFEGTLSAPGPLEPNMPGIASAVIEFEHNGANYPLASAQVVRGSNGYFHALDGTSGGVVAGPGTVTANGTFTSMLTGEFGQIFDQTITVGQPFRLRAGLIATMIGTGDADFKSTARLVKVEFFDKDHTPITDATVTSASGTFYGECTYALSPTSQAVPAGGGPVTVTVTAPAADCAWTASSNDAFLTVSSGDSGSGTGTVTIVASANTGGPRQGTVTIGGQTFTATQEQDCTSTIAPGGQSFAAAGGTGSVSVTLPAGCSWTATSNDAFVTISAGQSGTGPGTVAYAVAANSGSARTGTLTITGKAFNVSQDAAVGPKASGGGGGGCAVLGLDESPSLLGWLAAALALAAARGRAQRRVRS